MFSVKPQTTATQWSTSVFKDVRNHSL